MMSASWFVDIQQLIVALLFAMRVCQERIVTADHDVCVHRLLEHCSSWITMDTHHWKTWLTLSLPLGTRFVPFFNNLLDSIMWGIHSFVNFFCKWVTGRTMRCKGVPLNIHTTFIPDRGMVLIFKGIPCNKKLRGCCVNNADCDSKKGCVRWPTVAMLFKIPKRAMTFCNTRNTHISSDSLYLFLERHLQTFSCIPDTLYFDRITRV